MESLRCIVYTSTAVRPQSAEDLQRLLVQARDLNLASGVTGLLIHRDGRFLQCFEGTETAVAETYARIVASRRHRDVFELMNAPMARRSFADWRMAFAHPSQEEMHALVRTSWNRTTQDTSTRWGDACGLAQLRALWHGLWSRHTPQPGFG